MKTTKRLVLGVIFAIIALVALTGIAAAAAGVITKVDLKAKAPYVLNVPANSVVTFKNFSDAAQTPSMVLDASTAVTVTLTPAGGKDVNLPLNSKDLVTLKSGATNIGQNFTMRVEGAGVKMTLTNDSAVVLYVDVAPIVVPTPVPAATSVATMYNKWPIDLKPADTITTSMALPASSVFDGLGKGETNVVRIGSGALLKDVRGKSPVFCGDQQGTMYYCEMSLSDADMMIDATKWISGTVSGQQFYVIRVSNPMTVATHLTLLTPASTSTTDASGATVAVPKVGPADMHISPMAQPNILQRILRWLGLSH